MSGVLARQQGKIAQYGYYAKAGESLMSFYPTGGSSTGGTKPK